MKEEVLAGRATVNDAIRCCPETITVFNRFGIDACCGGGLPIAEAARRHGVDFETLVAELSGVLHLPGAAERGSTA